MGSILDKVTLTASGAFADTAYRQRLELQESWERGNHEAIEEIDVDCQNSNIVLQNLLGTAWHNRNRTSGVSRVVPHIYRYRRGIYGSTEPSQSGPGTPITDVSSYPDQIRGYNRPWYAYRAECIGFDGAAIQWNGTSEAVSTAGNLTGDMRIIGKAPTALSSSEEDGTITVVPGLERYRIYYKPQRYMVRSDAEVNALDGGSTGLTSGHIRNQELARYIVRDYKYGARALTVPYNFLYWASDLNTAGGSDLNTKTPIPEGPSIVFPCIDVLYTWVDCPVVPHAAILAAMGKVNQATTGGGSINPDGNWDYISSLDSTNWPLRSISGWPAGTLLFDGISDLVEHTNAAGQWTWDITYSFLYRPDTHNKIPRFTDTGTGIVMSQVVTRNTATLAQANWRGLYSEYDFNALFRCPTS